MPALELSIGSPTPIFTYDMPLEDSYKRSLRTKRWPINDLAIEPDSTLQIYFMEKENNNMVLQIHFTEKKILTQTKKSWKNVSHARRLT
jgi:hypothetical protein